VLEDQHRRFARHTRDLTVDELIHDQVTQHHDRGVGEGVNEFGMRFQPFDLFEPQRTQSTQWFLRLMFEI